jgi:hypothetical protein
VPLSPLPLPSPQQLSPLPTSSASSSSAAYQPTAALQDATERAGVATPVLQWRCYYVEGVDMVERRPAVPDPDLGVMRSVIIVGSVYGIIFGFLNSPRPLLPPPTTTTQQRQSRQRPRQRTAR